MLSLILLRHKLLWAAYHAPNSCCATARNASQPHEHKTTSNRARVRDALRSRNLVATTVKLDVGGCVPDETARLWLTIAPSTLRIGIFWLVAVIAPASGRVCSGAACVLPLCIPESRCARRRRHPTHLIIWDRNINEARMLRHFLPYLQATPRMMPKTTRRTLQMTVTPFTFLVLSAVGAPHFARIGWCAASVVLAPVLEGLHTVDPLLPNTLVVRAIACLVHIPHCWPFTWNACRREEFLVAAFWAFLHFAEAPFTTVIYGMRAPGSVRVLHCAARVSLALVMECCLTSWLRMPNAVWSLTRAATFRNSIGEH
mmetsp:Transcript_100232/g.198788  ORF Transcript_100232/g.198788 Transcript_100232/m.198788 type:complete len:314 (+) Transcript_100232:121-1062(+)